MSHVDPALQLVDALSGEKRKADDGPSTPQQRSKRNRYIAIACNECKRRKIKCNGNQPCQRCGNLNLECVYAANCCGSSFKDSDEWRAMNAHIMALQEQVESLSANLASLRSELAGQNPGPLDPSLRPGSYPIAPSGPIELLGDNEQDRRAGDNQSKPRAIFRGPTSNDFSFDVARHSLNSMGIATEALRDEENGNGLPPPVAKTSNPASPTLVTPKDPIWSVSREEALRLLDLYEEEMHDLYPLLSIDKLRLHTINLYRFLDAFRKYGFIRMDKPGLDAIGDNNTSLLKLIWAISLVVEGRGRSELGQRLFDNMQPAVDAALLGNTGMREVRMLALTAMYNFHCDDESAAWRVIGLAARLCMEQGLHAKETYDKMPEGERDNAVLLFWSIYNLDRRWSFGTGMPFAIQDSDIDPRLPKPGQNSLYLTAMIDFCAIGSKVWRVVGADSKHDHQVTRDEIAYLDHEIRQWHRNLPEELCFDVRLVDQLSDPNSAIANPRMFRLSLVLYLRLNSMRANIYRPILNSASSISKNRNEAQEVVNVAKQTIRVLTRINKASSMYSRSQLLFNAFLTSALAVLFLAASHDPLNFEEQVAEEFHLALDLVRGLSKGSFVSRRLSKTIETLKGAGPNSAIAGFINRNPSQGHEGYQQGLQPQLADKSTTAQSHPVQSFRPAVNPDAEDPSRSAALAMAGLAGHNMDEFLLYGPTGWPSMQNGMVMANPDMMANDLNRLFEAAGAVETQKGLQGGQIGIVGDGGVDGFGGEDELSRIMRGLF